MIYKFCFIMIIPLLTSCLSLNSHQTGRTLGKDKGVMFVTANVGTLGSDSYSSELDSASVYVFEFGSRFGMSDRIDIGYKINSALQATFSGKYQYTGTKTSLFASSVGIDFGVGLICYNGSVVSYNSIHLYNDIITLTFTPRYVHLGSFDFVDKLNEEDDKEEEDNDDINLRGLSGFNNIYGYSGGLMLGRKHKISFELSQFVNNKTFSFSKKPQFSVGLIFSLN